MLGYAKGEIGALSLGMVYLWLACVSDFVVPLYIGFVIDVLEKGEFHKVGGLCWQLFIIIVVRSSICQLSYRSLELLAV